MKKSKNLVRLHRKRRVIVKGTKKMPRLVVFRSLKVIYASLIDDASGTVLIEVDSRNLKDKKYNKEAAFETGKLIAEKALKNKITKVVFDRGGYKYHGKVQSLAEGARQGGLKF
jgi:large subunit ribosomal protein L18